MSANFYPEDGEAFYLPEAPRQKTLEEQLATAQAERLEQVKAEHVAAETRLREIQQQQVGRHGLRAAFHAKFIAPTQIASQQKRIRKAAIHANFTDNRNS